LGNLKTTACHWLLKVKPDSPCFALTDKDNKESSLGCIDEVIDRLGCG
jgi:hypothetical protein